METKDFLEQLEASIAKYDLLCHPFYKAWATGELSRDDLRAYALDYYHHVKAFPAYLAAFGLRLEEGELRQAVLANMCDENGAEDASGEPGPAHSELWLDFAEGMGASRAFPGHETVPEVKALIAHFMKVACDATPAEALAAFYAYESQVPRVAKEKARGLREMYGADEHTCGYFALHSIADVYHAQVWRNQLVKCVEADSGVAEKALAAAEAAANALWKALDGIERCRVTCMAA